MQGSQSAGNKRFSVLEIFILFFFAMLRGMWDLRSPARDWNCDPCSESAESWPLHPHESPRNTYIFRKHISSLEKVLGSIWHFPYFIGVVWLKWFCDILLVGEWHLSLAEALRFIHSFSDGVCWADKDVSGWTRSQPNRDYNLMDFSELRI